MKTIENVKRVDCELNDAHGTLSCMVEDFEGGTHRGNFDNQMFNIRDLKFNDSQGLAHANVVSNLRVVSWSVALVFEPEDRAKCDLFGDELSCYKSRKKRR